MKSTCLCQKALNREIKFSPIAEHPVTLVQLMNSKKIIIMLIGHTYINMHFCNSDNINARAAVYGDKFHWEVM